MNYKQFQKIEAIKPYTEKMLRLIEYIEYHVKENSLTPDSLASIKVDLDKEYVAILSTVLLDPRFLKQKL